MLGRAGLDFGISPDYLRALDVADSLYDLAKIHDAARGERIELDEKRARDEVLRFFETLLDCYPFAAAVLLELQPQHFRKRVQLTDPPHPGWYDEYGITISESLAEQHMVPRDWYLKVQLYDGLYDENAFLVSLHPAEYELKRGGDSKSPKEK